MLEILISSKTRLNLLIRFFLNLAKKSHLRGIASDFNESTNAIRIELNNLTKAGYLIKKKDNNKINYLANKKHPLFTVLVSLIKKHTGVEEIIKRMTNSIKNLKSIYIVGDYAKGIDSGNIKIYIEGEIDNLQYVNSVIKKTEKKINRNIEILNEIDPFDEKLEIYNKNNYINE